MKYNIPFQAADILIPKTCHRKFCTIACDQFTSQPDYWNNVEDIVGDVPSALHITLPEIYLSDKNDERISKINSNMNKYLEEDVFALYKNSLIYVERTLPNGSIRRGIIGAVDLEEYDYSPDAECMIRATEGTVPERIPPRVHIREDAILELPHVMLLIDDPHHTVIEPLTGKCYETVYDFDLMTDAGHLKGKLIPENDHEVIFDSLNSLKKGENPMLFAVGDGNHSLASAKECYLKNPNEYNRYALVEIVNIHDTSLKFEPIYRAVFGVNTQDFIGKATEYFSKKCSQPAQSSIRFVSVNDDQSIPYDGFPVAEIQSFINDYIQNNDNAYVDYIHGLDTVLNLTHTADTIGIIYNGIKKDELFPYVLKNGVLPRKAFSMGDAIEKRFYLECRKIK